VRPPAWVRPDSSCRENRCPEGRLSGNAMSHQSVGDCLLGRRFNRMTGISLQIGPGPANQVPAGPGAPLFDLPVRIADPGGQVLKVDPRIADECLIGRVSEYPDDSGIGQGPSRQLFFVSFEVGEEGPIDREQDSGRPVIKPEKLSVFEAPQIETGSPICSALPDVLIIQHNVQIRQVRAGSACFHTGRQCTSRISARVPFDLGLNPGISEGRSRSDDGNSRAESGQNSL